MKSIIRINTFVFSRSLLVLVITIAILLDTYHGSAQSNIPPVWNVLSDSFESGTLDKWQLSTPNYPILAAGEGHYGTIGLSVGVGSDSSYIFQTDVAKAEEGYLSFWFNPNGTDIPDEGTWIPSKSLSIAEVRNGTNWWPPMVDLFVRQPTGQGYQAYLAWPIDNSGQIHYDYDNGFSLMNGWQQIIVGFHSNKWVAVWCNGELMRYATSVVHTNPYADIVLFGKTQGTNDNPSGKILFDDVAFQVPRIYNLWVDANSGDDNNDGFTSATALRTIQRAGDLAGPGTTVHILPGVYRETVESILNGSSAESVHYVAENGSGTVVIRGSEPSSSLIWTQLTDNSIGLPHGVNPTNIYYANLSGWNLNGPPRFVVELDSNGQVVARLPLAREPDWNIETEWKYHEFWWAADGGASPTSCDPATDPDPNCDLPSRSTTQLTDRTDDTDPPGVEAGNLTTLGDLTGATLVAIDTVEGHYIYRRTIIAHDIVAGRITVDNSCEFDSGSGNPGLGWSSKYYVEGKASLLDTPGEWYYDPDNKKLYLWPLQEGNPATMNIEISHRENGFDLHNRSYITLDGLTIEFLNGSAVYQVNWEMHKSYNNILRNLTLRYSNIGVNIEQSVTANSPPGNVTDGFTVEDSEIAYMDSLGIWLIDWWEDGANPDLFTRSGIQNTIIRNNDLHHLGFRSDGDIANGSSFTFADKLRFESNLVHDIAHNGVQFGESVIQSPKEYGFNPSEIKTGDILVKDNLIENTCQLTTDCGGLKIWGLPPDNHVFRNFLVTGNVFRNTFGWAYISEKRQNWTGGETSEIRGLGGFGLYVDTASGIHAYRNIAYNNAYTGFMVAKRWSDGELVFVNNVAANSLYGISLDGGQYDPHDPVNTQLINNILINNECFGISLSYPVGRFANTTVDNNLYYINGWRSWDDGGIWHAGTLLVQEGGSWDPYQTIAEVRANTPWEEYGLEDNPLFWNYDLMDHDLYDDSWPDFHLTVDSINSIDRGAITLPTSLSALLDAFKVIDFYQGSAYDIGRYEAGFQIQALPNLQAIDPGDTAYYTLSLFPSDAPYSVTLSSTSPSPNLTLNLIPTVITGEQAAKLEVTDFHLGPLIPGEWYILAVTGSGDGFSYTVSLGLLVGGARVYLPISRK